MRPPPMITGAASLSDKLRYSSQVPLRPQLSPAEEKRNLGKQGMAQIRFTTATC